MKHFWVDENMEIKLEDGFLVQNDFTKSCAFLIRLCREEYEDLRGDWEDIPEDMTRRALPAHSGQRRGWNPGNVGWNSSSADGNCHASDESGQ